MEGILFSNLDEYVIEKDELSCSPVSDKWFVMPYECGDISGRALYAGDRVTPRDVTLSLGLTGYHKIFVATVNMRTRNQFNLRISSDEGFSSMTSPTMESRFQWAAAEYFEEFLWKCADLTGEDVILRKPDCQWMNGCTLAFIRCVPISREEYEAYLEPDCDDVIHGHFDEDVNGEETLEGEGDLLTRYPQLVGGDIREMSLEFSFDYDSEKGDDACLMYHESRLQRGDAALVSMKETAYRKRVEFLHSSGIKAYATNRMSVATFTPPYSDSFWTRRGFVDSNPQYYCRTRLGEEIKVCSYAYPEVRRYSIDRFLEMMEYGFDGVTLILNRGLHIGFEAPVIEEFARRYPDIDPHTLPASDERLHRVWCDFMTKFMRELRAALDGVNKSLEINVICDYAPDTSKNFGLDVAAWAREGLVDRVMQGIMEVWEDLDGTLDGSGLIDLKKYREKLKTDAVIKRFHGTSLEKTVEGSKKYLEALTGSDVKYYATLHWSHKCAYSRIENYKAALRDIGVKNFLSWNTDHTLLDVAEMHAIQGRGEEYYTVNRYRTLRLAGSNMSDFNPNWRG